MKKYIKILSFITSFFALTSTALAYSGDISINSQNIRFSNDNFLEGRTTRIYASASNKSEKDLLGAVRFFDNGAQIGGDQAISIFAGKTDDVFIDWTPDYGTHKIAVKIFPWDPSIDDPSNNWVVTEVFAMQDTDHDGTPNNIDNDDDGDGVPDNEDHFPLNPKEQYDTDGDGLGNNTDPDDDNDGVPDKSDDLPLDPNETIDTDKDGIGNNTDLDDDGDSLSDAEEENLGTNPVKADTDEDDTNDKEDAFPLDPNESVDTDKDKIGNNIDTDDDNDGLKDAEDPFPENIAPEIKLKDENEIAGLLDPQTFDASPSYDKDGEIVSYLWEIDDTTIKEGNSITNIFKKSGEHKIKLTVTDNSGEKKTKEFQISVINLTLYKQFGLSIFVILLALIIFFKYITEAKKPANPDITK